MAAAKSTPKPEVATLSDEEMAANLIETSLADLPNPKPEVVPVPTPIPEAKTVTVVKPEPEIINDFYESLGVPYCKKCGERSRTSDGENTFCPIAKPNCSGFSV
jgi:hypothetical protein